MISLTGCVKRIQPIDLSLPELLENYQQYQGKRVLLRGEISDKMPFGIYGVGFRTWFFILESGGKKIRCFEDHYRVEVNPTANHIILRTRAERKSGKEADVTVIGDLERDGLELYLIEYKGITVRTDLKYPEPFLFRPFEPWW
jgi:hypothetical protein